MELGGKLLSLLRIINITQIDHVAMNVLHHFLGVAAVEKFCLFSTNNRWGDGACNNNMLITIMQTTCFVHVNHLQILINQSEKKIFSLCNQQTKI